MKVLFVFLFAGLVTVLTWSYSSGITGTTEKNGEGCTCHNLNPNNNMQVWVSGPAMLLPNQQADYRLYVVKPSGAVAAGLNVAAGNGTLATGEPGVKLQNSEITHLQPKQFAGDTLFFAFKYTAPASLGTDTLFSVLNAVNFDGQPNTQDQWKFAPKFAVTVTNVVPVEFTSFSAARSGTGVVLTWSTATETNNAGFEIEKSVAGSAWRVSGFVKGKGTSAVSSDYTYTDNSASSEEIRYRLNQVDYNGEFSYSQVVIVNGTETPTGFELAQNYPNPFNPSTVIRFSLEQDANVSLKVFDVQGRLIADLANGLLTQGSHSYIFDAASYSSGIYYYELKAVDFSGKNLYSSVKKMMLMR
ncbi:MAG: T9SS type A sorting domain-containing protein [Ignavibacteriaceae bacterium]|nr:T9SS type A sorting domain-containing protein [Ignavibacteriaceae bacterium]